MKGLTPVQNMENLIGEGLSVLPDVILENWEAIKKEAESYEKEYLGWLEVTSEKLLSLERENKLLIETLYSLNTVVKEYNKVWNTLLETMNSCQ